MEGEKVRRVDKQALLSEVRGEKVYINPKTAKVSTEPSEDSIAIPRTWWGANHSGEVNPSPIFSVPEVREKIRLEVVEMSIYFPDFELYENVNSGEIFWLGKIDGIGEIKITYPLTYPAQKFTTEILDLEESFNEELNQLIWRCKDITPAGAIIVAMRFFLSKKVSRKVE
jgi:hypothetical protein